MTEPAGDSVGYVLSRLAVIEHRAAAAVERRRAEGDPSDRFRGLYISEEDVDRLLAGRGAHLPWQVDPAAGLLADVERRADELEGLGVQFRLRRLATTCELNSADVDLLMVALAPDVDIRFERLFGYLHDDVSRRRASIALALELTGCSPFDGAARQRLGSGSPLSVHGLIDVLDVDRPLLSRELRVAERVVAHLLGSDRPGSTIAPFVRKPAGKQTQRHPLVPADGQGLVHVRSSDVARGVACVAQSVEQAGGIALVIDLAFLDGTDLDEVLAAALLEARLRDATLVVFPLEALVAQGDRRIRMLAESGGVTFVGRGEWDPAWSSLAVLSVSLPPLTPEDVARSWNAALGDDAPIGLDPVEETVAFELSIDQIERAADGARRSAAHAGRPIDGPILRAAARQQNSSALARLARRTEPTRTFEDLVLEPRLHAELRELIARVTHRRSVLDSWGIGDRRRAGVTALFTGESGTGKTMAAEVVTGTLGLDLYVVNLATVVDKYIGETEKNLERVFTAAEGVNAVLLFDEADAVFGKRSEVRDAHDRYANIETAYLLQRLECFDGFAILTSNLRSNIDTAFTRRFDVTVDFPVPTVECRRELWERALGDRLPRADDLDLDFCAARFEMTGGHIRNVAVTAASLAAAETGSVTMAQLMRATVSEYHKLGRLCVESEFGSWLPGVASEPA